MLEAEEPSEYIVACETELTQEASVLRMQAKLDAREQGLRIQLLTSWYILLKYDRISMLL
jgi:hypothetical protein